MVTLGCLPFLPLFRIFYSYWAITGVQLSGHKSWDEGRGRTCGLSGVAAELQLSGKCFADKPESYSATHSKNCNLLRRKRCAQFGLYFSIFLLCQVKNYQTCLSIGKKYKQTISSLLLATVGLKFSSSNLSGDDDGVFG